jgi:hypothetical protein
MEKTFIVDRIDIYRLNNVIGEGNLKSLVHTHEKYVANLFDCHSRIRHLSGLQQPCNQLTPYQIMSITSETGQLD